MVSGNIHRGIIIWFLGEAAYLAAFLLSFFRNAEDIRYGIRHGRASDGTETCREPEEGLFLRTFPILGTQNSVVRQKMVHKAWFKPLNS